MSKSVHPDQCPIAGQRFLIEREGIELQIEVVDWWDRLVNRSWNKCLASRTCLHYAMRSAWDNLPANDDVLLVSANGERCLMHVSELM